MKRKKGRYACTDTHTQREREREREREMHPTLFESVGGVKSQCISHSRLDPHIKPPRHDSFSLPYFLISSFTVSFLSHENSGTHKFKAGASNNSTAVYFSSVQMLSQIQFEIDEASAMMLSGLSERERDNS